MGKTQLNYIAPLKFLLILGVILIHANIASGTPPFSNAGIGISNFVSSQLGAAFVPSFFIISGYLFFLGVERFTRAIYVEKLKRRFFSLVVPYVLWNLICVALLLFKFRFFHFDSYGVYEMDGAIDWSRFIKGFWDFYDGYPYAQAFWFIRNLICFVILSPIVYVVGRKWWLTVGLIAVCIVSDTWLYYIEFFTVGASFALNRFDLRRLRLPALGLVVAVLGYFLGASLRNLVLGGRWFLPVYWMLTLSGFVVFLNAALRLTSFPKTHIGMLLIQSTFFIYAFHQCFCSLVRNIWLSLVGDSTTCTALISYVGSFVSMVAVSFAAWLLLRRIAPRILNVLTGNR